MAKTAMAKTAAKTPLQYLDKASSALRDLGLMPEKVSPAPIAVAVSRQLAAISGPGGEQQLEYGRPLVAGDRITVRSRVAEVQEKAGPSGPMDVIVIEDEARGADGEVVFRSRETFILRRG